MELDPKNYENKRGFDDNPRHGSNTDPILVVSDHGSLYFLNRHDFFAGD